MNKQMLGFAENNQPAQIHFLTGVTGFLGAYLALHLLVKTDAHLVCLARSREGLSAQDRVHQRLVRLSQVILRNDERFHVSAEILNHRITVIEGDIRAPLLGMDADSYAALQVNAIWHCAADVDFAEHRRRQVMATNHQGTLNVLALAKRMASRGEVPELNYVSTAYVCGDRGGEISELIGDEAAAVNNPYEESKRLCERAILMAHADFGLRFRIMRPSIVVGHSRTLDVDSASGLYTYLSVMLKLKDTIGLRMPEYFDHHALTLHCDDDVTLNLVCVDQVVEAMVSIAQHGHASHHRFYHLVNPNPPLVKDYLKVLTQIFGICVESSSQEVDLNPVDALMNNQTDIYGAYLRNNKIFKQTQALQFSGMPAQAFELSADVQHRLTQGIYDHFNEDARQQRKRSRSVTQQLSRLTLVREGLDPLHYYAGGCGDEVLVIVNAYGQSLAFWDAWVATMAERCRVVIWQVRGTLSQSGGMVRAYPIAEHVRDMQAILDAEGVSRAHLLGWCTGPKTALEFYAAQPHRVASMTFLTGCFINDEAWKPLYTGYENYMATLCGMVNAQPDIAGQLTDILKSVLVGKRKTDPSKAVDASHHEPLVEGVLALIGEDIKPLVLEPFLTPSSIVNYARQLLAFWGHDVSAILPRVAVPTLFVGGEVDNITSPHLGREVSRRVPGAVYAEVQGGTHYMHFDNHALIADMVWAFMRAEREAARFAFPNGLVRVEHSPASTLPALEQAEPALDAVPAV